MAERVAMARQAYEERISLLAEINADPIRNPLRSDSRFMERERSRNVSEQSLVSCSANATEISEKKSS